MRVKATPRRSAAAPGGWITRIAAILTAGVISITTLVALPGEPAQALDGDAFRHGLIISDQLFYDRSAMTAAQIQSFLDARVGTCTNGQCLNVAQVNTPSYPARISPDTGRLVCSAVSGGVMPVSEWIYRVQVACSISAKVILVTLQKEQGLVTNNAPGNWALTHAMGMACPDTAPCDSAFAGLATQIYTGTRQLMTYKASAFGRQPGWHDIRWNPNAACGSSSVLVQNDATAALYNYTPYQPNAAALANLSGTGDSCSSYGNRNFWRFYTSWFGNPLGEDGTNALLEHAARDASVLGAVVEAENCTMDTPTCWQRHERGSVYWEIASGTYTVLGTYDDLYRSLGGARGPMGAPLSAYIDIPTNPNGAGAGQTFRYGTIYSSAAGVFAVMGAIRTEYGRLGSNPGSMGWPLGAAWCVDGGCVQRFQGGYITLGAVDGVAGLMAPEYEAVFLAAGGIGGSLGVPLTSRVLVTNPRNGNGEGQVFQNGTIYSRPSMGPILVRGPIRDEYGRQGSNQGAVGWPTAAEDCRQGVCSQTFQGGVIAADQVRGAAVLGDYAVIYAAAGGPTGSLGMPTSGFIPVRGNANGDGGGQLFVGGNIYSSAAGAYVVTGAVLSRYGASGGNPGPLGWPTAAASCASGACVQQFQGGRIYATTTESAAVPTQYVSAFEAAGGLARLGPSESWLIDIPSTPSGAGAGQSFARGTIYSSARGAYAVVGETRAEYSRRGSYAGAMGWPTGPETCSGDECSQSFQGGAITSSGSVPAGVASQFVDVYRASGGTGGPLGRPTSGYIEIPSNPNGRGAGQIFEGGTIYSSAAGVFAVTGSMRDAYARLGSNPGPYGWPTGAATCSGGVCSQPFQGGTIFTSGSKSAGVAAAFVDAYRAAGGITGPLGASTSAYIDIPSNPNGRGAGQIFEGGTIYSSAAGVFAVTGSMRDAYARLGSNPGPYGWPTGAATCSGGVCSQPFQGGTIFTSGSKSAGVAAAFVDAYRAAGGITGPLGASTSAYIDIPSNPNGRGAGQIFEGGTIYSSAAGVFAVTGSMRDAYARLGSNPGPYGWPTGAATCSGGVCSQPFQGGTITT